MENEQVERVIIKVSDDGGGRYSLSVPSGSSVGEVLFATSVVIKCFVKDGLVTMEEAQSLLNKYLTDPQYDELVDEDKKDE